MSGNLGFYGKLPCKGDFFSRGLSSEFIFKIDGWLQEGIALSKEKLGEHWDDTYMVSPIWHFYWPRGICGEGAWIGSIMPSVDKANRLFPFVAAAPLPASLDLDQLAQHEVQQWYGYISDWLLAMLENERCEVEEMQRSLAAIGIPELDFDGSQRFGRQGHVIDCSLAPADADFGELVRSAASTMVPGSVWWRFREDGVEPACMLMVAGGLPTAEQYVAMHDEDWRAHDWLEIRFEQPEEDALDDTRSPNPQSRTPGEDVEQVASPGPGPEPSNWDLQEDRDIPLQPQTHPEIVLASQNALEGGEPTEVVTTEAMEDSSLNLASERGEEQQELPEAFSEEVSWSDGGEEGDDHTQPFSKINR